MTTFDPNKGTRH